MDFRQLTTKLLCTAHGMMINCGLRMGLSSYEFWYSLFGRLNNRALPLNRIIPGASCRPFQLKLQARFSMPILPGCRKQGWLTLFPRTLGLFPREPQCSLETSGLSQGSIRPNSSGCQLGSLSAPRTDIAISKTLQRLSKKGSNYSNWNSSLRPTAESPNTFLL